MIERNRPTKPITVDKIGEFELLKGVGLAARLELIEVAAERRLAPGDTLLRQGDENDTMYLVVEGQLDVFLDSVTSKPIATITEGQSVGELSVLDGSAASAHVVAGSPCRLLAIEEAAFWRLTHDSHAFAVNLLVTLAARLRANNATVSQNVTKRRHFERAALFDGLTGIHNRRWLDETLHRVVDRHDRNGSALALCLADIDHFKSFNDRYGHEAGDYVLTVVASALTDNVRPSDLVARFGGEEFVLIFPDTNLQNGVMTADRVRQAVSLQHLVMPDGRELPGVTISIGVAQLEPGQSVPSFLKTADAAMYRAKSSGRDRVEAGRASDLGSE